ncbi:unnamed protein product [Zymoseptoria tritici ST99CH_1A5]|uniref:Peptidase M3A/M3B catalytic domain-containing protein n=1 Tax=Zymoseptoria tritici ST99CH_1A5 TaxID=1276529 RepID=A0A1Y6LKF7_ZYMTR|nr:unnamed protein product [Zymoseptoria tritici ST99CH_1A5]
MRAILNPLFQYQLAANQDIYKEVEKVHVDTFAAFTSTFLNESYFKLVDHVFQTNENGTDLDSEDQTLLSLFRNGFVSQGLVLPAGTQRDEYNAKLARIDELTDKYMAGLKDPSFVYFTAEELDGVSTQLLQTFEKGTGNETGKLGFDAGVVSTFTEVATTAKNETTRFVAFLAYAHRAPENIGFLKEQIELRLEVAQLLNYTTWVDYAISSGVARSRDTVLDFIADVGPKVRSKVEEELAALNEIKSKDAVVSPVGDADVVYRWDKEYYGEIERRTKYDVDAEKTAAYFPVNFTVPAILDFYGKIYGIYFDRIQGQDADALSPTGKGSDLVWHPDVWMYAVWDNDAYRDAYKVNGTGFRGYLHLDLFYREGVKDGSSEYEQCWSPGYIGPDGCEVLPSVMALLEFEKSDNEDVKPSLIPYADLPGLMHELGHCMHDLLSTTKSAQTHGTVGSPSDFVEFPSQFMENFSRVPEALKLITKHWSSYSPEAAEAWRKEQGSNATDAPLPPATMPDDLIAQVIKSTENARAIRQIGLLTLAQIDQDLYGFKTVSDAEGVDPAGLFNTVYRNFSGIPDPTDIGGGIHWGNFVGQIDQFSRDLYAGTLYSYAWCFVYAEDLFYSFFVDDPFNAEVGMRYRTEVLQPGASTDQLTLLTNFLGRAVSKDGYYKYLGVSTT